MHNPESFQENEMHQVLWDFEIQKSPNLGQTIKPLDNKEKIACWIVDFAVPQSKNKRTRKER